MTVTSSSHSDEWVNHISLLLTAWASTWPPSSPSQILSQTWVVISQLRGERHWMKMFDIWPYCLNVLTSLQKYCLENTFIRSIKSTFCSDIIKPLLFCEELRFKHSSQIIIYFLSKKEKSRHGGIQESRWML